MANDGSSNWAHMRATGDETPMSLLRYSPHDEEAGASEIKGVYPPARKKPRRRVSSADAHRAMLGR